MPLPPPPPHRRRRCSRPELLIVVELISLINLRLFLPHHWFSYRHSCNHHRQSANPDRLCSPWHRQECHLHCHSLYLRTPSFNFPPDVDSRPIRFGSCLLLGASSAHLTRHQDTVVDPAFAVLGVILILTGLPSAFWGHKNRWYTSIANSPNNNV
jgi:hypothetical protein